MSGFDDVDLEDLEGPTVGVVVAERLETVADLFDDIVVLESVVGVGSST